VPHSPIRIGITKPASANGCDSTAAATGGAASARMGRLRCQSDGKGNASAPALPATNENESFLEAAQNAYGRFAGLANKFMPVSLECL